MCIPCVSLTCAGLLCQVCIHHLPCVCSLLLLCRLLSCCRVMTQTCQPRQPVRASWVPLASLVGKTLCTPQRRLQTHRYHGYCCIAAGCDSGGRAWWLQQAVVGSLHHTPVMQCITVLLQIVPLVYTGACPLQAVMQPHGAACCAVWL